MHIVTVVDGRPGHVKQIEGVIAALGQIREITTRTISVNRPSFAGRLVSGLRFFTGFFPKEIELARSPDLILCAGSTTHDMALLLKKKYQKPAFVLMDPGLIKRYLFDCCFVPRHDGVRPGKGIFETFGAPNGCQNLKRHDPQRGLILVGGRDPKSHSWDSTSICLQIEKVLSLYPDLRWSITSSPRTPDKTITELQAIAKRSKATFFDFRVTPAGWVEDQYAENAMVWVTPDSISMIYEALSAGCRVGLLRISWKKSNSKFHRNERILYRNGMVLALLDAEKRHTFVADKTALNEAQRCAEHILFLCKGKN